MSKKYEYRIFRAFLIAWVAIGIIMLLASCNERPPGRSPKVDLHDSAVISAEFHAEQTLVKINWVNQDDELLDDQWGMASYIYDEETRTSICVIITSEPVLVDDVWSDTLGHEILHCLKGDYHDD